MSIILKLVNFTLNYSGYMPPEYVRQGQFSTRSDVYSFGVLVLEIICGRNNRFIHQSDTTVENLVTYVSTNSMINCGFNCIYVLD